MSENENSPTKEDNKPNKATDDATVSGESASGQHSVAPDSLEGIFLRALQIDDRKGVEIFLDDQCADPEQRKRVSALLRAYNDAGSFLETPVGGGRPNAAVSLSFLKPIDKEGVLGTIGPYEVLEDIGRGGMGIVLRAIDLKLNRIVAVKVLLPELAANPNSRRRFLREAQAAAAISHPHVVTIHAVDDTHEDSNGKPVPPYLVMECVVGQSLQQKLDRVGTLRLAEILRIGRQIGEGLAAAHKQGVIHRDIKPANILLENGVERVKITDFGLARAIDDITVTRTGEVSGTPQYMSPEQASGERVDHRSDLFSLGCVMYAMCTGHSPFRGDTIAHVIKRVTQDAPRPIAEQNPEIPPWLAEIITCLLQKNPEQRFQSAEGVVAILDQHLARIQQPTESGSHSVINQQVPVNSDGNAARPGNTIPSLSAAGLLGPSGKVLVPKWMQSLSRIWLMLAVALVAMAVFVQNQARVQFGPLEFLAVFTIGGLGSIVMASLLSRKVVSREVMAIALFMGLGPFGLLLYVLVKDGLKAVPEEPTRSPLVPRTQKPIRQWFGFVALISIMMAIGSVYSVIQMGNGPVNFTHLIRFPVIMAVIWVIQLLMILIRGKQEQLRNWPTLSAAAISAMIVGFLWTTLLTCRPPVNIPLLEVCLVLTPLWGLFCVYAGKLAMRHGQNAEFVSTNSVPAATSQRLQGMADPVAPQQSIAQSQLDRLETERSNIADIKKGELSGDSHPRRQSVKRLGIPWILAALGGTLYSLFTMPAGILRNIPSDDVIRRVAGFAAAMLAAWIGQLFVLHKQKRVSLRSWGLLSSVAFGCIVLGYFWSTILRLPYANETAIGLATVPSVVWLIYASFVMREAQASPGFHHWPKPTPETSLLKRWAWPAVVICGCGLSFFFNHNRKTPAESIDKKVAEFVSSRFHSAVTSTVQSAPGKAFAVTKQDGEQHLVHVRRKDDGRWELDPDKHATKIEIGRGDTLGPANDEWGGLIIDSVDHGTYVAITGLGPRISGEGPILIPAGRHKLPVGTYGIMVFDTLAGWLNDVKSNDKGDYQKIYKTVDHVFKNVQMEEHVYDAESGTYTFSQYNPGRGLLKIEPGEFAHVDVSRSLKAIASGSDWFNREAEERFMPGQFYRFLWNGKKYSLSADQAKVVDLLVKHYANQQATRTSREDLILPELFPDTERRPESLKDIFNDGEHPAWDELIKSKIDGGAPVFHLTELE